MIEFPTTASNDITASVSDQLADPGALLLLGVILGIPLFFWVTDRLVRLIPGGDKTISESKKLREETESLIKESRRITREAPEDSVFAGVARMIEKE